MFVGCLKGWIGIDLGTRAIKLAQVERVGTQCRLAHTRIIPRNLAVGEEESGASAVEWWNEILTREDLREGFVGRRAACVLSASQTDLRAMNVPEGSAPERRAMIETELESIYAATEDARVFDFWETRSETAVGESNLENVNVVTVAEEDAASVATSLMTSGFDCQLLDALPLALARAVQLVSLTPSDVPVAVVDWGSASATFSIIRDQQPVFTRHLRDCGYSALPTAVAEALAVSVEDAEQLLIRYGVADPAPGAPRPDDIQEVLTDISSEPLARLVSQLTKTLSYPELHRSRLMPERIWLFGGGATIRNVPAILSERIGAPIQAWSLPRHGDGSTGTWLPLPLLGAAISLSALAWQS